MKIRKKQLILVGGGLVFAFLVDQPRRLVPTYWETGLAPGGAGRFVIKEEGDITLKFVAARLRAGGLELVPVPYYKETGPSTQSVKEFARRFNQETQRPVLAAVNGGFFDTATGLPIGFLLREGRMEFFNMPQGFQRSMVGFAASSREVHINSPREMPKVWMDALTVVPQHPLRSGSVAVHHINVPGGKNALALFTPTYGVTVRLPKESIYLAAQAENGRRGTYRIIDIQSSGSMRIPAGGLVVALHGDARARAGLFQKGTLVRPRWSLPADWTSHAVASGLLAGPRLLEAGNVQVTAKAERLDKLISQDRVALAVKANGDTILVWAHKNTPGNLSYELVAAALLKMGATEAIALDGGRSRAILAQSGGAMADERYYEGGRPVSNALVLSVKEANRT